MKKIFYITSILLLFSCDKETFEINNLNGNEIYVLGHGGMGISNTYPINSLESLASCLSHGAHGSEIDIQMTKDSVLVAFHDSDLSSSTNMSGIIHDLTWEEVKEADYINIPYTDYHIIALTQLFDAVEDYNTKIFTFDVKLYPSPGADIQQYHDTYTNAIINLFNAYNLENNVYLESQNTDFLNMMQSKQPNYALYIYPQTFQEGFDKALQYGYRGITISSEAISKEQVQQAHSNNLYVTIWGVDNKEKNKDAVRKSPDMIQTDDLDYLINLLK